MTAIILGVTAAAVLSALVFPDSGDALSGQNAKPVPSKAALSESTVKCTASAPDSESTRSQSPAVPQSISPFELSKSINNVRRTKVDVSLKETWQKLGIEPGSFAECGSDCEAKIFRHEFSSHTGPEVVLKLTRFLDFCRYLVFARAENNRGWKFLGHVDHDFNKYEMARHRIASVNGRPFLVVRGQEGSGSGFALYAETWYEVRDKGVTPVLSYPSQGQTYPWPAGLARSFKVMTIPVSANQLTIQYTVTYHTAGYDNDNLKLEFVNRHRVSYNWDDASGKFAFDPQRSNISQAEVNAVANIQSGDEPKAGTKIGETTFYSSSESRSFIGSGYEVFLKYNLPRLMTIAKGRAVKSKNWLRQFLTECRDTDEKKTVLAAFGK